MRRNEKSRRSSWNRKRPTGFIKPHRIGMRARLRAWKKYGADMIAHGVKAALEEEKRGAGNCPEGEASGS